MKICFSFLKESKNVFKVENLTKIFFYMRIPHKLGYTKATNKWCRGRYGRYTSLDEAQEACENDSNCMGVQDYKCNGGIYRKCKKDKNMSLPASKKGTCTYVKGILHIIHS